MYKNRFQTPLFIAYAVLWTLSPVRSNDLYDVGSAVVDITPDYPIRLNGFGNRRDESEGVSQRIYAKALAISRGDDEPLVLVTLDSLGIRTKMADAVAKRLLESHQLPRNNLTITFTHTHCAPKVNGASDNIFSEAIPDEHQKHIDQYSKELQQYITMAASQAIDNRKPARLEWAVGKAEFAKNRRAVGGPVDHDLPMLVVIDPATEKPQVVYVSYACHCVTLSFNQISGDWAGYAAAMIERQVPGCVAMVSIGAGSDQNPISGVVGDQVQIAEGQGLEIAAEVNRMLAAERKTISGSPESVLHRIPLPLNATPTREQLLAQTEQGRPTDKYNATTQLARLDRGEELISQIDYSVQTWTFGDSFCMTFLAGEVCVDYALRLKQELDRERFWLNGYSNDFCCYIPSERLVLEGGYGGGGEVPYFALPATLKAGLESTIVDEVLRQVPETFHVAKGTQGVPPKSPAESLKCMTTHDNLQIVLAASEPNITDPVAIDFGADGRLWVAEMNDYGQGVFEGFEQHGRIRWLRDNDNDGFFETAQTFVDGLRFPTDVKVWRDGVLICDAPDILFARDTDDDGTADEVHKLFTGFDVRNAQARVNSLRFGLDGWLYGACGLFGGNIQSSKTGLTVDCSNRDFRIDADTGIIEPVSGRTQQGRCRNDFGDWFGCSNGTLLRDIPSDDRYEQRNPFAPPSSPPGILTDAESYKLYPPENLVTFELSGSPGVATSACGLGIYRDRLLGAEYFNDAFTCEPVHQSVHRIDLAPAAHGYEGRRGAGEAASEFLSSTDRWFRPVQARTGPDGALWVVDMYRYVIEHSRWIPQSTLAELDVYAGQGRGRIYRILPKHAPTTAKDSAPIIPRLSDLPDKEVVAVLNSENGILRDLAHQLLLWRKASAAVSSLRELFETTARPATAIHILYVLHQLNALQESDLLHALQSAQPDVLRHAVLLSEAVLIDSARLQTAVFALKSNSDVRVRRQVAFSTGTADTVAAADTIIQLLSRSETDAHVRSAALNSVSAANIAAVLRHAFEQPAAKQDQATLSRLVLLAMNVGDSATISQTIQRLPDVKPLPTGSAAELWVGILNALDDRFRTSEKLDCEAATLEKFRRLHAATWDAAAANDVTTNPENVAEHLTVIRLLGRRAGPFSAMIHNVPDADRFSPSARARRVVSFVSPRYSATIQKAAIAGVAATGATDAVEILLGSALSLSGDTLLDAVDVLLSQTGGPLALLSAVETGQLRTEVFDAARRSKILSGTDKETLDAAERVFGAQQHSSRTEVVASMEGALNLAGDVTHGQEVFRKRCSSCHKLDGIGFDVGPDLRALTSRDDKWLLTTILDPNKDVDARYIGWTAVTQDGRTASGMIVEESATSILLRESGGKEHVIARSNIDEFRSSQKSVMPEGLERDLSAQDFRDVIAFVTSLESPYKQLPGNQPQTIPQNNDGVISLMATTAELRGGDIVFETPFANIGYWHHQNDSATWRFDVADGGSFDVYANAACDSASADNRFQISGLPDVITGAVASTGGWDRYRQKKLGTTTLKQGTHVIRMQASEPIRGALFDLREIRLVRSGSDPGFAATDLMETPLPRRPPEIAPFLLDESESTERRQQVIDQRPGMGPAILPLLTEDLKPDDIEEEYRRIPWIWRVAIAVGKRNDGGEIRDTLEVCVPAGAQPLRDWQAVVIGGGLINGASQIGVWPRQRINEILGGLPEVKQHWQRALQLAVEMADNETVRTGTRYDALRMVAMLEASTALPILLRYLTKDSDHELQMGAVSGLSDVESPAVISPLLESLNWLTGRNRTLAIEALFRSDERAAALETHVQSGGLILTDDEKQQLLRHPLPEVHTRAQKVLKAAAP